MPSIVMLNGAFGVGKTTLAKALIEARPDWHLFDPEEVGAMLWQVCPGPRGDFQYIPLWAPLVVETGRRLLETYGRSLVVPMTLVDPRNYAIVREGFAAAAPTHHFALVATPELIASRLRARGESEGWGHDQIERCVEALDRPEFSVHLEAVQSIEILRDTVLGAV